MRRSMLMTMLLTMGAMAKGWMGFGKEVSVHPEQEVDPIAKKHYKKRMPKFRPGFNRSNSHRYKQEEELD